MISDIPSEITEFNAMVRHLRVSNGLKQREACVGAGLKPSSYGNVESNKHKSMRRERVLQLARFYQLDQATADRFLVAWDAQPISDHTLKAREGWARNNSRRSKARKYDTTLASLLEVTTLLVANAGENAASLCACEFGGGTADDPTRACELCTALQLLGMTGFTSYADVMDKLADFQGKLASGK